MSKEKFGEGVALLVKRGILEESFDKLELAITAAFDKASKETVQKNIDWLMKIARMGETEMLLFEIMVQLAYLRMAPDVSDGEMKLSLPILQAHMRSNFKDFLGEKLMVSRLR